MGLKALIENQTIIIDDHKCGNGEVKKWDDPSVDVHIDKSTNFKIEGEIRRIRIRVPINSARPIKVENGRKGKSKDIPRGLKKEIWDAFANKKIREDFIKDLVKTIQNFETILSSEDRVRQVLSNISKHFDLEWTKDKIATYANSVLQLYTETYRDKAGRQYLISVDKTRIKIGEDEGFGRHIVPIRAKRDC